MFKLSLLTPEKKVLLDQDIESVTVPLASGEAQILKGHVPMIATLGTGILKYQLKGQDKQSQIVISWGYCEVTPDAVSVLAEFVKSKDDVNVEVEKQAIATNTAKLISETLSDEDFEKVQAEIAKSQAGLKLV